MARALSTAEKKKAERGQKRYVNFQDFFKNSRLQFHFSLGSQAGNENDTNDKMESNTFTHTHTATRESGEKYDTAIRMLKIQNSSKRNPTIFHPIAWKVQSNPRCPSRDGLWYVHKDTEFRKGKIADTTRIHLEYFFWIAFREQTVKHLHLRIPKIKQSFLHWAKLKVKQNSKKWLGWCHFRYVFEWMILSPQRGKELTCRYRIDKQNRTLSYTFTHNWSYRSRLPWRWTIRGYKHSGWGLKDANFSTARTRNTERDEMCRSGKDHSSTANRAVTPFGSGYHRIPTRANANQCKYLTIFPATWTSSLEGIAKEDGFYAIS